MIRYVTPEQRTQVGDHVKQRRRSLGMSVSEAARRAEMSRPTWIAVEAGTRDTEDHTLGRIENALQWPTGAIGRLAEGEDVPGSTQGQAINDWRAKLIAIRDNPRRNADIRTRAAAQLIQLEQVEALLAEAEADEFGQRSAGADAQ
jgi:transcriptional regulator with XRE-family HTH domain